MLLEVATCRIYDYGELRCLPKSDACIPGSLLNLESMQVSCNPPFYTPRLRLGREVERGSGLSFHFWF